MKQIVDSSAGSQTIRALLINRRRRQSVFIDADRYGNDDRLRMLRAISLDAFRLCEFACTLRGKIRLMIVRNDWGALSIRFARSGHHLVRYGHGGTIRSQRVKLHHLAPHNPLAIASHALRIPDASLRR